MASVGELSPVRGGASIEQRILICALAISTSIVLYGLYYYLQGAWQLLAMASGDLAALATLGLSLHAHRRWHPRAAAWLLLLGLLIVPGMLPLLVADLTPYAIAYASLLVLVVGAGLLPGRWRTWLIVAAAFGCYAWLIDWLAPLPRYVHSPVGLTRTYLLGTSTAFLALILWHSALVALRAFTSIRARLFVTSLLLVLFTGGALSYFLTIVLMYQQQNDAVARLSAVAMRKQSQIEHWADDMRVAVVMFAHHTRPQLEILLEPRARGSAEYLNALKHVQEDLGESSAQARIYDNLYVLDASGNVIASLAGAHDSLPPLDPDCLTRAEGEACLQPPRYYAGLGRFVIVAAVPVVGRNGRVAGIVAGYAGLEHLSAIAADADGLGDTGTTYLVDMNHTLLTPPPSPQAPAPAESATWTPGVTLALATRSNGSELYQDRYGTPVVGVYRWLPPLQSALLTEQAQAEAFRPATIVFNVYLGVTLLLLIAAAVTALYLIRSITAPLDSLAATARQIAGGALDVTAEIQQDDEIGALARAFNQMTGQLRQALEQLEQRVQQRTKELAHANAELQAENSVRRQAEQALQIERNKLKSILDAMEDGVYIVNQRYEIEYVNPALERDFGPQDGRKCYEYLYGRADVCLDCPNERIWQGQLVREEQSLKNGKIHELFHAPLHGADGTVAKLAIFHDVTARRQAENEILQRNHDLAILSRRLVEIQESERQHIARELHDETGQALTSLMLRLGMLERDLQRGLPVADRVAELKRTVEEVLSDLHALAIELRPASLDHVGLVPALRQYAERLTDRHGLEVDFGVFGLDDARLPPAMEITIYRIVQEALVNVVRHAQASRADVIVERRPGCVRVIVEDNGLGFDTTAAMYSGRLGLLGMRERAEMLGGQLEIDSAPGSGTTIVMEAPYGGADPDRG